MDGKSPPMDGKWWAGMGNPGPDRPGRQPPDESGLQAQTAPDTKRGPPRTPSPDRARHQAADRTRHQAHTEPDTGRGPSPDTGREPTQTPGANRTRHRRGPNRTPGADRTRHQARTEPDTGRGPTDPGARRQGTRSRPRARTGLGAKAAKLALAWRFGHVVRLLLKRLLKLTLVLAASMGPPRSPMELICQPMALSSEFSDQCRP